MIKQIALGSKVRFFAPLALIFAAGLGMGLNPALAVCLAALYAYFKLRPLHLKYRALYLILLLLLHIAGSFFILRAFGMDILIPFCVTPVLVVLLFNDLELSLLMCLAVLVSSAVLNRFSLETAILSLSGGLAAALLSREARRRNTIIQAGLFAGAIQCACIFLMHGFAAYSPNAYALVFLNGLVSAIIVLGTLPIFEYIFSTVTNVSLLELADFNHPLMQRLILEAPGTYHHSLVVGNISEAACRQVGANALLARIGAYYHDIGKLEKSAYFSENQELSASKHEDLSPSMSKIIIMNHVREGLDLARRYNLSPMLSEFILRHHGNSLVYYFYRRALEKLEEDQAIKEEGFRYPGPKPNTKETAIVLLADSVEAATRALKEPTPNKIEEITRKVINNKFIDGQLDECDLTLKDIEKISSVFVRILSGIYHTRVNYPEQHEGNGKKSAKEGAHQPEKGKGLSP